jgi:hypothetical protein
VPKGLTAFLIHLINLLLGGGGYQFTNFILLKLKRHKLKVIYFYWHHNNFITSRCCSPCPLAVDARTLQFILRYFTWRFFVLVFAAAFGRAARMDKQMEVEARQ